MDDDSVDDNSVDNNAAATATPARPPGGRRGVSILIVEDSPVQAELLCRALEGEGYTVIAAANGAEAIRLAQANPPAAVVSDINMPVMDGYAMCEAIRRDAALKHTPVILLTMLSDPRDVIRGLNAGADAYVTKPYNIPSLVARIASLLTYSTVAPATTREGKVEVRLAGETHLVDAYGPRMLNLLVSTYENAVLQNRELQATQQALDEVNQHLARRAKELEAANKELESFGYSVSHDLAAPLRSIDYFSKALLERCANTLGKNEKSYVHEIRSSVLHMGQLIEDMLQLARVARSACEWQDADLTKIATDVADRLRLNEPGRQVEFRIQAGLSAKADARLLRQVFENLLGNAWKFTGSHACATIEVGAVVTGGKTTYFVRDDGAGFEMASQEKLFVPFQRLHGQSEFPGTGIGLAIVQRIVQRHGGTVWAEGQVEHGASFFFTLG
jgi:signal transduction histidine kinase